MTLVVCSAVFMNVPKSAASTSNVRTPKKSMITAGSAGKGPVPAKMHRQRC